MASVEWRQGTVRIIDQRRLPGETVYLDLRTPEQVADAIRSLAVRGAPAIGVCAAMGLAVAAQEIAGRWAEAGRAGNRDDFLQELNQAADALRATRPTAVNLFWALDRMLRRANVAAEMAFMPGSVGVDAAVAVAAALVQEARRMAEEDVAINRRMGEIGQQLITDGMGILTHCNTGALATVDFGTALGVIRAAHEAGKRVHVFVDETRPVLQGARLTAWELQQAGIPATLITDNMAAHFMRQGQIQLVLVGADRVAANGDVANKIGTYGVAVLARAHGIPFYPAVPTSTIDLSLQTGDQIVIEQRNPREVTHIGEVAIAPAGIQVANPAFDVTPAEYVTGIITEKGIVTPPFYANLRRLLAE